MSTFIDRTIENITLKKSHVVVGLDPVYNKLPSTVKKERCGGLEDIGLSILEFNQTLIDAVFDLVPSVKPQIAFYEQYGLPGMEAFLETVKYAKKKGLIVIEDAKRNDIGSTAGAYSDGHIGKVKFDGHSSYVFDVDAITVNPYLGSDGIIPFLKDVAHYSKGLFILVKTSNPSSKEIQDIKVVDNSKEKRLYEIIARLVNKWGKDSLGMSGYSSVGAVVGATFPEDAKVLRQIMPNAFFLVPGYGAQGGTAADITPCFNNDGYGALIAASRSIDYAFAMDTRFGENNYADAARETVKKMNEEINQALRKCGKLNW